MPETAFLDSATSSTDPVGAGSVFLYGLRQSVDLRVGSRRLWSQNYSPSGGELPSTMALAAFSPLRRAELTDGTPK